MRGKPSALCRSLKHARGFSLTELVVTLAVGLVLIAVGLPAFLRAYHSYELSSAASQLAGILRLARYEAIRLNQQVPCVIAPDSNPGMTDVWVDSVIQNGKWDTLLGEKGILLGSGGNLIDPGTSGLNPNALIANAVGTVATTAPSPTSSTILFDARGALSPPTSVNVFYLASAQAPEAGFRAVLLMPAGSIQIWTSDNSGNWLQQR